jgi:hypothetical protein
MQGVPECTSLSLVAGLDDLREDNAETKLDEHFLPTLHAAGNAEDDYRGLGNSAAVFGFWITYPTPPASNHALASSWAL